MPYNIIKNKDNSYKVVLKSTGQVLSKHTTLDKAHKQIRVIEMLKHNPHKTIKGFTYFISDKPNKKLMTFVDGKKVYFGDPNYQHYRDKTGLLDPSLNHLDDKRRNRYIMRASNIVNKKGEDTQFDPKSPNYHALNILW
jgi:hypothetical protein